MTIANHDESITLNYMRNNSGLEVEDVNYLCKISRESPYVRGAENHERRVQIIAKGTAFVCMHACLDFKRVLHESGE